MQWHQLDHMQTICTSLQTDNHTKTSSLNFYRPDAVLDAQPTVSMNWRQHGVSIIKLITVYFAWQRKAGYLSSFTNNQNTEQSELTMWWWRRWLHLGIHDGTWWRHRVHQVQCYAAARLWHSSLVSYRPCLAAASTTQHTAPALQHTNSHNSAPVNTHKKYSVK